MLLKRTLRSMPHLYSTICRARLFYSRSLVGAPRRRLYRTHRSLCAMNAREAEACAGLTRNGYTVLPDFFDKALIDRIYDKADRLFRDLKIGKTPIYSGDAPMAGLTYEQIAATQKLVSLSNPFLEIPEYVAIAFHESLLRITANFLGYIPRTYQGLIVRDFPHHHPKYSSNFHKDNDEADSLQIFVYLVDSEVTRATQVYVPGSHRHDARSCRPRLSEDLGTGPTGCFTDEEVARVYPPSTWATLRTTRGSVGFISGNGIHKGPAWASYGDPRNRPRTALRIDVQGFKAEHRRSGGPHRKLSRASYEGLSPLQRLFTGSCHLVD